MIVVTGATGHLGNGLVRALLDRRAVRPPGNAPTPVTARATGVLSGPIRAIVRPGRSTASLAGLDVEFVTGDVGDFESLVAAFQGADVVFHVAGTVSITRERLERLRKVNVEGTKNVLEACRLAGVERVVYVSSIHAFLDAPRGQCTDETAAVDPGRALGIYGRTKAEATLLVRAAAREGLDAVIVHPSGVVGPYDYRPSQMGQLMLDFVHRRLPAYVDGAYNFVDVRDVALGTIGAYERGRTGESYLLGGQVVTVRELLQTLAEASGVPAPRLRLNFAFVRGVSFLIPIYYRLTGRMPLFTTYSLDVIASNCCMSSAKAERELGFSARPFAETVRDTLEWFKQQGML